MAVDGWASDYGPLAAPPPAEGLAVAPVQGDAQAVAILGTGSAEGVLASSGGWAQTPGPLGPEQALAGSSAGWAATAGPLGPEQAVGWNEFASALAGAIDSYVCDLTGGAADLRVPISSWQATLQTDRQQYLQVVVPSVTSYASEITARASAGGEIVVTRVTTARDGTAIAYEMARGPISSMRLDRGSLNYSATLSGYTTIAADPQAASKTLTLSAVRSTSVQTAMRARAAIDWLLRPGMTVVAADLRFTADYISIYVNTSDAYMDVGERAV